MLNHERDTARCSGNKPDQSVASVAQERRCFKLGFSRRFTAPPANGRPHSHSAAAAVFIAPASDTKLKARVLPAPSEVHIAAENTPIAARSH